VLVGWVARRLGRPARWVETRGENLLAMPQGRDHVHHVAIGGTRDGRVLAYELDIVADCGAYPSMGAFLPYFTRHMATGTYDIARVRSRARSVVTNTVPTEAFRGAGRPEATATVERAMDLYAGAVGLDPAECRRRNLVAPDAFPYTTAAGATYDNGAYEASLDKALAAAGYDDLRAEQARRRAAGERVQLGIGVSVYVEITGASVTSEFGAVRVEPADDGDVRVTVLTGSSPHGQGLGTALTMVASEVLGIPMERIEVRHGDTDEVPWGMGTMGSRSLQMGGSAVHTAATGVVDAARALAAEELEAAEGDVVLDAASGRFHVAGTPARSVGWAEVAAAAERLVEHAALGAVADEESANPLWVEGRFDVDGLTFPFGCHVAVVEVDMDTGLVELSRLVACDDAGRVLNPLLAEGQRHGGITQGVAQALFEHVRYDDDGNPLTATLADYGIPSAADLPRWELVDQETPTPMNPLGVKGIGESGTIGATPAVQSAVIDALSHLGVRHLDLPLSPERVWRAVTDPDPGNVTVEARS
jgi:carbon-monoxide dehydrogenase large subunit